MYNEFFTYKKTHKNGKLKKKILKKLPKKWKLYFE